MARSDIPSELRSRLFSINNIIQISNQRCVKDDRFKKKTLGDSIRDNKFTRVAIAQRSCELWRDTTYTGDNIDDLYINAGGFSSNFLEALPKTARTGYERHGADLSKGYPELPPSENIPLYVDNALNVGNT
jgi:hypothetical protein